MKITVRAIEGEEYYLEHGIFEHACKVVPPRQGSVECDVCGVTTVDDFDYYDESRER